MTARRWLVAFVIALAAAWSTPPPASAQREIQIYRPQHRIAEELEGIARVALGERGVVSVDRGTNALILAGDADAVADALALLEQQDRALKTVILTTAWRTQAELEAAGVDVAWQVEGGSVRIGNADLGEGTRVFARVLSTEGTRDRSFESQVRVLDGQTAQIGAGRTVPVETGNRWERTTTFVTGTQGFTATPRVLGDGRVRVTIDPVDERVSNRGVVAGAGASTIVELKPGETAVLGGIDRRVDSARSGLSAGGRERANSERLLLLTVEIADP